MHISLLLTCFNRREKTCSCLQSLFEALDKYNASHEEQIQVTAYMVDDGCTDGTADAVRALLPDRDINILQGDGNLFWAGGMRFAWREAMKRHQEWDYYLLVNDDTDMLDSLFEDLMQSSKYAVEKFGTEGIFCGFTCDPIEQKTSFGASSTEKLLNPAGIPQEAFSVCANVLLVPKTIVDNVGIFDEDYVHGAADYDYGHKVRKAGFPVLTTCSYVGICENEHRIDPSKILSMSFAKRRKYLTQPPTGKKDYLVYLKKNFPKRFFPSWLLLQFQICFPQMYVFLFSRRVEKNNKSHNR